jgi:putative ABC transport system permease protein
MAEFKSDGARLRYELKSALSLAWDSIIAHRLRSFLTLLGVMIGVASVILVGAAIDGLGTYAKTSTEKAFGSQSYILAQVAGAGMTRKQVFDKLKVNRQLKLEDERYLQSLNGENTLYSPYRNSETDAKREGLTSEDTTIIGASWTLADIRDLDIADGRFFSNTEEQNASFVAVIGDDLKNNLFPGGTSPIGKSFKIQDLDFTVIGVQDRLGSTFGQSRTTQPTSRLRLSTDSSGPASRL